MHSSTRLALGYGFFDDIYYSSSESEAISGESEFQHVFFKHNGLPERWQGRNDFVIAELGFGSGLNCLLTIREWLKHCAECNEEKTLHYVAIEKYPLSAENIVDLISQYSALKSFCDENKITISRYHEVLRYPEDKNSSVLFSTDKLKRMGDFGLEFFEKLKNHIHILRIN